MSLMNDMKIFPMRVFRQPITADNTVAFLMEFHHMDMTKIMFQKLHRLRRRVKLHGRAFIRISNSFAKGDVVSPGAIFLEKTQLAELTPVLRTQVFMGQ